MEILGIIVPLLILLAIYAYLEFNKSQQQELTDSQIWFLQGATKGNVDAEKLVALHLGKKLSPREYANLRCKIDAIVSSGQITRAGSAGISKSINHE